MTRRALGIAGWSGSGKTTLVERLIPELRARGLSVSTLKHAHHRFDVDVRGKDSWRHRAAGAREVLVVSDRRLALMRELDEGEAPPLEALLDLMAPVDLVLVEGYKSLPIPKIEVWRPAVGKPRLAPGDPHIVALVTDALETPSDLPVLDLNRPDRVADFALAWFHGGSAQSV